MVENLTADVWPVFHVIVALPVVVLPEQLPVPLPEAVIVPLLTFPVPWQLDRLPLNVYEIACFFVVRPGVTFAVPDRLHAPLVAAELPEGAAIATNVASAAAASSMRLSIDEVFARLAQSSFRRKFRLAGRELAYLQQWGLPHVMKQAASLLAGFALRKTVEGRA